MRRLSVSVVPVLGAAVVLLLVLLLVLGVGGGVSGAVGAVDRGWGWPVAGPPTVVREYAAPATSYGAGHRGLDLAVTAGAAVLAPADGVVAFVGTVAGKPVVAIDHGGGYRSSLEPVVAAEGLAVGTAVVRGQPVGVVGSGGSGGSVGSGGSGGSASHCGGCVHFGVRLHGEYLDPRVLLTGVPRAILLPLG